MTFNDYTYTPQGTAKRNGRSNTSSIEQQLNYLVSTAARSGSDSYCKQAQKSLLYDMQSLG
jgi:hypothetical protein